MSLASLPSFPLEFNIIFVDLEGTGLRDPDIIQLSAIDIAGENNFDAFIMPSKPVEPVASKMNRMSVRDGDLHVMNWVNGFREYTRLDAKDPGHVLRGFEAWLVRQPGKKILVAHNGTAYDFPHLLRHCIREGVDIREDAIHGFADSLIMAKRVMPYGASVSQERLLSELNIYAMPGTKSHDARYDAGNLRLLCLDMAPLAAGAPTTGSSRVITTCVMSSGPWYKTLEEFKRKYAGRLITWIEASSFPMQSGERAASKRTASLPDTVPRALASPMFTV